MDADIVKRMRLEASDLERKLKAVRDFLAAYGDVSPDPEARAPESRMPVRSGEIKPETGQREKVEITSFTESTRTSVVLAMEALLSETSPVKTRDLVDYVESSGHKISGENKVNALGALLGRSVDIVSHGKSGWTLTDKAKAEQIVATYLKRPTTSAYSPPPYAGPPDFTNTFGSSGEDEIPF